MFEADSGQVHFPVVGKEITKRGNRRITGKGMRCTDIPGIQILERLHPFRNKFDFIPIFAVCSKF